jgi:hypothetical protein
MQEKKGEEGGEERGKRTGEEMLGEKEERGDAYPLY